MPRRLITHSLVLLLLSAAGCESSVGVDGPQDSPLVEVLDASTLPGTPVTLRMHNASSATWGYNPCSSPRLQRRNGDTWVDAPEPLILCSADIHLLQGGQTHTIGVAVPLGYVTGTYRVRFGYLRRDGVEASSASNSFVIE